MKAVVLLAGKGRRIRGFLGETHKSMINLNGRPLLWYLVENIRLAGISEIIPAIGYKGEELIDYLRKEFPTLNFEFAWNREYDTTNNLVSLVNTEKYLNGDEFIMINGDLIYDYRIIEELSQVEGAAIALDINNRDQIIDSPKTIIRNNLIQDLGRHIDLDSNGGYAIGIYRFSRELAKTFFGLSKKLILDDKNMGFHDPLRGLFNTIEILPFDIKEKLWTDIDEEKDIDKALQYIKKMENNYAEV